MKRCRTLVFSLLLIGTAYSNPQHGFNFDSNPYLSNGYANDVNAFLADQQRATRMDLSSNVFLQHMIEGAASQNSPVFAGPGYLPPVEKKSLICSGPQVCVPRNACSNGYFSQGPSSSKKDCDVDSEVCCQFRPPATQPPRPTPPPQRPTPPSGTPCTGNDFSCVSPNICVNGVIKSNGFLKSSTKSSSKCFAPEVCCRVPEPESTVLTNDGYQIRVPETPFIQPKASTPRPFVTQPPYVAPVTTKRVTTSAPTYLPPKRPYVPDRQPEPSNTNFNRIPPLRGEDQLSEPIRPSGNNIAEEILPPIKCAAALNCTEVQFCTATGVISKTPVILTKDQELFRVPLTDCRDLSRGYTGKCCRDPDYVDPWPTSQLGQYKAENFGDTGKYKPPANNGRNPIAQPSIRTGQAILSLPIQPSKNQISNIPFKQGQCVSRNTNAQPKGPGPYDAAFGEYPWQVMVLKESTKSLLCGGAIVGDDVVATAAHCVDGLKPFDVLVKAGEWKLGSDEEPLDFQLVRVKKIETHPKYESNTLKNDMALLHLDAKLKYDKHIAPICIDDKEPTPADDCVTTGWGKQVLKVHAQDAIMHHSPVAILPGTECNQQADGYHYEPSYCAQPSIDACELDYGSALACKSPQGYVMKGIYSTEQQCGGPMMFTKPDSQWINAAMAKKPYSPEPAGSNAFSVRASTRAPLYLPPSY